MQTYQKTPLPEPIVLDNLVGDASSALPPRNANVASQEESSVNFVTVGIGVAISMLVSTPLVMKFIYGVHEYLLGGAFYHGIMKTFAEGNATGFIDAQNTAPANYSLIPFSSHQLPVPYERDQVQGMLNVLALFALLGSMLMGLTLATQDKLNAQLKYCFIAAAAITGLFMAILPSALMQPSSVKDQLDLDGQAFGNLTYGYDFGWNMWCPQKLGPENCPTSSPILAALDLAKTQLLSFATLEDADVWKKLALAIVTTVAITVAAVAATRRAYSYRQKQGFWSCNPDQQQVMEPPHAVASYQALVARP